MAWPYWLSTVRNDEAGPYWSYSVGPESVRPNWVSKASSAWIDGRIVVGIDDGDGLAGAVRAPAR